MFATFLVGEPVKKEILKEKIVPRHPHVWLWTAKEKTTELPRIAASRMFPMRAMWQTKPPSSS